MDNFLKTFCTLRTNLIHSLATGLGDDFATEECRAILATRTNALCRGYSGVREELVDRLIYQLNNGIIPVIPEIGSVGASGDLVQLAHLTLPLVGEGYAFDEDNKKVKTSTVFEKYGLKPLTLLSKEGLAMVSGTSAMTGIGCMVLEKAKAQVKQAEIISAIFCESQYASTGAYEAEGHQVGKPHAGQIKSAANLRMLLNGSQMVYSHHDLKEIFMQKHRSKDDVPSKYYLQKAYTLRCIPQIFGAIKDTLEHAEKVLTVELNSSNDNPLFFEGKEVFHSGNFHDQPVAFVMDFMTIALTQLGVVAERQLNRLLDKKLSCGLTEFLSIDPGLCVEFEGAQFPATALVAENRTLCTPASIQSIPCNEDNQDVVSFGLLAAKKARQVLKNNNNILAILLLAAIQAVDLAQSYKKVKSMRKNRLSFHSITRAHASSRSLDGLQDWSESSFISAHMAYFLWRWCRMTFG